MNLSDNLTKESHNAVLRIIASAQKKTGMNDRQMEVALGIQGKWLIGKWRRHEQRMSHLIVRRIGPILVEILKGKYEKTEAA